MSDLQRGDEADGLAGAAEAVGEGDGDGGGRPAQLRRHHARVALAHVARKVVFGGRPPRLAEGTGISHCWRPRSESSESTGGVVERQQVQLVQRRAPAPRGRAVATVERVPRRFRVRMKMTRTSRSTLPARASSRPAPSWSRDGILSREKTGNTAPCMVGVLAAAARGPDRLGLGHQDDVQPRQPQRQKISTSASSTLQAEAAGARSSIVRRRGHWARAQHLPVVGK